MAITLPPTIKLGSKGGDVRNLQVTMNTWANNLKRPDFFVGTADGVFGSKTEAAVKNLQYALGLTPDGIVGPLTWTAINKTGEALLSGQGVGLRPPRAQASAATAAAQGLQAPRVTPPAGGFDLASLFGANVDWKLAGMALAIGIGFLYLMSQKKGR